MKQFITLCIALSFLQQGFCVDKKIKIKPVFNGRAFLLGNTYLTENGDSVSLNLVKVYLSNFSLTMENGEVYHEENSYHLIDLEADTSLELNLKNIPDRKVRTLSFNIGVDSTTSCSGAMSGDLDPLYGMYWAWNSGYINAKIEGTSSSCQTRNSEFQFHIGGYKQKEATLQKVTLSLDSNSDILINMNIAAWFENISLKETNTILIPGKEAQEMAQRYQKMFSISN